MFSKTAFENIIVIIRTIIVSVLLTVTGSNSAISHVQNAFVEM